jgi:lysozyme family protein
MNWSSILGFLAKIFSRPAQPGTAVVPTPAPAPSPSPHVPAPTIQLPAAPPVSSSPATATPTTQPDNFIPCVTFTFQEEGGYSDTPGDPGGATNYGITLNTLQSWVNQHSVTQGDGTLEQGQAVTPTDVQDLTLATAQQIYQTNYWNVMSCGSLAKGVDLMVFDFGVNAGPGTSGKELQQIVGTTVDGQIGPITVAAAAKLSPGALITALKAAHLAYYQGLSGFAEFGNGWTNRLNACAALAAQMAAVPVA